MEDIRHSQIINILESETRLEQIRLLYGGLKFALSASAIIALIIYFIQLDYAVSKTYLNIWLAAMLSLIFTRSVIAYFFYQAAPESHHKKKWSRLFISGSLLAGIMWGLLPWLGQSFRDEYQALTVICIVGVTAGSLSTLSYRWAAVMTFLLPATTLLELNMLVSDGKFASVTSLVLAIFMFFIIVSGKRIYNNTQQNIRLRIEAAHREQAMELLHQKQVLHAQQTPLAVIELDTNLKINEWNNAAEEIFGYSRSEAISKNLASLIAPDVNQSEVKKLKLHLNKRDPIAGYVIRNIRKDNTLITCEWYITPLTNNDNQIVCIAAMALDITEKKRVEEDLVTAKEESERANQAKSIFLSNVSHELRTPLNAIIGYTQLLSLNKDLNEKQSSDIDEINNASQLLLNLVNQILDLSKIEEGTLSISYETISLQEVITSCISLVTNLANENNVELKVETAISGIIHADKTRIKQVIINLLTNAIKYNREDGEVLIACKQKNNNTISIAVKDTGPGIPLDKQSQLFQPFNRLGIETKKIEGIGIGLSIAKELTEMMGGSIHFTSNINKGCTFWIEIEGTTRSNSFDSKSAKSLGYEPGSLMTPCKSNKVLVAEDNPTNQKLIVSQLNELGYKTDLASNGTEALELISKNKYSLILTDCNMPIMDGYELAKTIRGSGDHNTPVIAITADAFPEREQQCIASGMNGRIVKPFTLDKLNSAMKLWLKETDKSSVA